VRMSRIPLLLTVLLWACSSTNDKTKGSDEEGITYEEASELAETVSRASISQYVPGTEFFIYWREAQGGTGKEPTANSEVTVRFSRYVDFESEKVDGSEVVRTFEMGGDEVGKGIQVAVSSMQVGSIHEVSMREEVAGGIWKGILPGSVLHIRMELLEVSD